MIIDCGGRCFASRLFLPARQEGRHYVLMYAGDAGSGEKGGGEGWEMGVGWQVKKFEWDGGDPARKIRFDQPGFDHRKVDSSQRHTKHTVRKVRELR